MKHKLLSAALLLLLSTAATAQKKKPAAVSAIMGTESAAEEKKNENSNNSGIKTVTASQVMKIKIPSGGANAASVVYNPKTKKYYAAQAGNMNFPLVIFDEDGAVISDQEQTTMIDVRGLWYNPKTKDMEGNGYNDNGWFTYEMGKNGIPEKVKVQKQGLSQPDANSAGVLNTNDNEVLFLSGLNIVCYNTDGTDKRKTIQIHFGATSAADDTQLSIADFENTYNIRSLIFTGTKGVEIGVLNVAKKQVELYDIKTGYMKQTIKIPAEFAIETYFNFSYANGIYWLFDKNERYWYGYR
ncbi:hypothetical protein ESA94_00115 [Lacibacter luteus]|uniref:Uncharacterized protein n=1 Tax=Lacibacter luteus TaxID=2508719 RepID=A0A4Q1CKM5_9BACT|nr:hypothetical protein [Lacibacter luteus]RXK61460.1 hypothetical protein ESA94_00115 [Lacibacter luteus]